MTYYYVTQSVTAATRDVLLRPESMAKQVDPCMLPLRWTTLGRCTATVGMRRRRTKQIVSRSAHVHRSCVRVLTRAICSIFNNGSSQTCHGRSPP